MQTKRARFKAYKALKKGGKTAEAKEEETTYSVAKHVAKHATWLAKSVEEKEEFVTISPDGDGISVSRNWWTAKTRTLLCTQWFWWA